jgi:hypothetical protein
MQVGRPRAAQSLGKRLMTTGIVVGTVNSVLAGGRPFIFALHDI